MNRLALLSSVCRCPYRRPDARRRRPARSARTYHVRDGLGSFRGGCRIRLPQLIRATTPGASIAGRSHFCCRGDHKNDDLLFYFYYRGAPRATTTTTVAAVAAAAVVATAFRSLRSGKQSHEKSGLADPRRSNSDHGDAPARLSRHTGVPSKAARGGERAHRAAKRRGTNAIEWPKA